MMPLNHARDRRVNPENTRNDRNESKPRRRPHESHAMRYIPLGQTDITISHIGIGCVTFGREIDQETSFAVADRALERGITVFDSAEAYHNGESERVLGGWIRDRGVRDRTIVCTKVLVQDDDRSVVDAADQSLKRLGMDSVDLYYVHQYPGDDALEGCLKELDQVVRQGKARCVGCSNFDADRLQRAVDIQEANGWARMQAVQPNYNLVNRDIESDLLPYCRQHNLAVFGYSPLGAGFLTGKYSRGGDVPEGARFDLMPGHQDVYFHDEKWRVMEALRTKSEQTGVSMIHLALAWAIRQQRATCTLIGARKPEHIDQAFIAEQMPEITEELLGEFDAL